MKLYERDGKSGSASNVAVFTPWNSLMGKSVAAVPGFKGTTHGDGRMHAKLRWLLSVGISQQRCGL
jgi:hypothetical protein